MQRRSNDAQVERLLQALQSLPYRQDLARRLSQKEKISYKSAMRRLQRYITESEQKRAIYRTPAPKRKILRQAARQVSKEKRPPIPVFERPEPTRPLPPVKIAPSIFKPPPPMEGYTPTFIGRPKQTDIIAVDYWAVTAYHDGDVEETSDDLRLSRRASNLLELATTGDGITISGSSGVGELDDAIRDFYDEHEDAQDAIDFSDLLHNLPAWEIGLIMEDIRSGATTFSDWLDRWHEDGMVYRAYGDSDDQDLEDSAFWELWREAYARSKK